MNSESLKRIIITALCVAEQTGSWPIFDCATEDELEELSQAIREVFPEFQNRNFIPIIRFTESPGSNERLLKEFSAISLIAMNLLAEQLSAYTGEPEAELLLRIGTMAADFYHSSSVEELNQLLSKNLSFLRQHPERN